MAAMLLLGIENTIFSLAVCARNTGVEAQTKTTTKRKQ
jgi:hypothetical protein